MFYFFPNVPLNVRLPYSKERNSRSWIKVPALFLFSPSFQTSFLLFISFSSYCFSDWYLKCFSLFCKKDWSWVRSADSHFFNIHETALLWSMQHIADFVLFRFVAEEKGVLTLNEILSVKKVPGVTHPITNSALLLLRVHICFWSCGVRVSFNLQLLILPSHNFSFDFSSAFCVFLILWTQFDEALEGRINFKEFAALLEHIRSAEKKVRERRLMGKSRSKKDKPKVWKAVSRETGYKDYTHWSTRSFQFLFIRNFAEWSISIQWGKNSTWGLTRKLLLSPVENLLVRDPCFVISARDEHTHSEPLLNEIFFTFRWQKRRIRR